MTQWTAISRTSHANAHYLPRQGYTFAKDQQAVPVLLAELAKLIPHYTLGFVFQEDQYLPVALTGIGDGKNLYVNPDGKWLATYVPAFLRSHPFRMLTADSKQQVLCIFEAHLTDNSRGEPLFDQQGNLSGPVQETLDFLNECEKSRQLTRAACKALDQAGVIEKWPLQIKQEDGGDPVPVNGVYRVSEQVLNSLNAQTFAGLRSHGALPLAYAQVFSVNQITQLTERVKYHAKQQKKPDTGVLFNPDDDMIRFE